MKFLVFGDLHGQLPKAYFKDFDAIITPGDFCSDRLRKVMFKALREHLKNPEKRMRMWYELMGAKRARKAVLKSIKDGRKVLEKLNAFGVPVYVVPGNWDWTPAGKGWSYLRKNHWKTLIKGLKNVKDCHDRSVDIGNYCIIGYGISSGPEKMSKNDFKNYRSLYRDYSKLFKKAKNPVLLLSHNVPFKTPIDRITNKASPRYGQHFGSNLVRGLMQKFKPVIAIGGHMHEHFRKCKVGKTIAINAGYGNKVNVWVELEGKRIKRLKFFKKR